jgi:predicted Na+-dependent transporter
LKSILRKQWFLVLLVAAVGLSLRWPSPGVALNSRIGLRWFIFTMVFLMSFTLKFGDIGKAVTNVKGLAVAVTSGYVVVGALAYAAARLVFSATPDLAVGIVIVGAVPTTLVSCAVWTRLAGGNDALALAASVASNAVSFLVAPLVLNAALAGYVSGKVKIEPLSMMREIFLVVVLPVGLGQLARIPTPLRAFADRHKLAVSAVGQVIVLMVVAVASSCVGSEVADFGLEGVGLGSVLKLELAAAGIHLAAMAAAHAAMKLLRADDRDRVAAMMVGGQKTLPASLWMATTFFKPYPLAVLAPMLYHVTQLVLDSLIVALIKLPEESPRPPGDAPADMPAAS